MKLHAVVAASLVGSVAVVAPASATADVPLELYVATTGSDGNGCTSVADACATVQHAVDLAGPSTATVHVGPGTFAGAVVLSQGSTTISGAGAAATTLTAPGATAVTSESSATVAVERLTITDARVGIAAGTGSTTVLDAAVTGTDQDGLQVDGGTVSIERSLVADSGASGIRVSGGTTTLVDSTVAANDSAGLGSAGMDVAGGALSAVRSTLVGSASAPAVAGTVTVAGSVLAAPSGPACTGAVVDAGYNIAVDATCKLTAASSAQDVGSPVALGQPGDHGGPTQTVAGSSFSPQTDWIPPGATSTVDPTVVLCPPSGSAGTDQRGVTRPQHGRCDAGAVELGETTTTVLSAPTRAVPGRSVTITARVAASATDPNRPAGQVSFGGGSIAGCAWIAVPATGVVRCTTTRLPSGLRTITVAFFPSNEYLYSSSYTRILVGTAPVLTAPASATFPIGQSRQLSVTASGQPAPVIASSTPLPKGLRFTHGTISGRPAPGTAGRYPVTVTARNAIARTSTRFVLVVSRVHSRIHADIDPIPLVAGQGARTSFDVYGEVGYPTGTVQVTVDRRVVTGCGSVRLAWYGGACTLRLQRAGRHTLRIWYRGSATYLPARLARGITVTRRP
jgi:hypothetical protein